MPGPHLLCDLGRAFSHFLPALLVTGYPSVLGLWLYHSHVHTMTSWLYLPSAFPLLGTTVRLDGATLCQELILTRCLQRGRSWQSGKPLECAPPLASFFRFHQGDLQAWINQSQRSVPAALSPHTLLPPLTSIPALLTWVPCTKGHL